MGLLETMRGSVQPFIADGVVARNLAREAAIDFKVKAKKKLSPKIARTLNTLQIVARIAREKGVREKLASSAPILGEAIHLVGSNYAELIIIGGPALAIFVYDRIKTRQDQTVEQPETKSLQGRYSDWLLNFIRETERRRRRRQSSYLEKYPINGDIGQERFIPKIVLPDGASLGILDLVRIPKAS